MNYLILGGTGYIGAKVTRELVLAGHSVVCTRRMSSDLSRLADVETRIRWIPASIDGVKAAMQYTVFDGVLNMACNYGRNQSHYEEVIDANLEFPLKVLDAAAEHGTKKYLTLGTGLPDEMNMYSFSKKVLSDFGRFYATGHALAFNCLRLEMFYGADEPENRFLPSIITRMINQESVDTTVGTQKRDIIASEDVVKAILMVLSSDLRGYHEIPVGTGVAPSVSEIVDFIWENTGKKSVVRKGAVPMRKDEPDCIADTSFLSSLGTWDPIPWKKGILNMITQMEDRK